MSRESIESAYPPAEYPEPDADRVGEIVERVWLPRDEVHLRDHMTVRVRRVVSGRITYQYKKQEALLKFVRQDSRSRRPWTFVDVGAHVGLWSMWWAREASHVAAFEPVPTMRSLFRRNVTGSFDLFPVALGAEPGDVGIAYHPGNTGNSHVVSKRDEHAFRARVERFDDVLSRHGEGWPPILAMKLDCEGYEEAALRGAVDAVRKYRPVVCVEQKAHLPHRYPSDPLGAVKFLEKERYETVAHLSGDYIMLPEENLQ